MSPSPTSTAVLTTLVATAAARAVVEVGTGTGVTGLAIFQGMTPDGVLTTIDADGNNQAAAKSAFASADIDAGRARLIMGVPTEVLPRLTDAAYDVVVINELRPDPSFFLDQALRLLRPGGVMVFANVLGGGRVADPLHRDPQTITLRELGDAVKGTDGVVAALLPLDEGTLVAVKQG